MTILKSSKYGNLATLSIYNQKGGGTILIRTTESEEVLDNIGERIKKERERLGLSQAELGRLVGYSSRSTINKIEKGERDIPRDKVAKFAQVLGVNPAYLAGFKIIRTDLIRNITLTIYLKSKTPHLTTFV